MLIVSAEDEEVDFSEISGDEEGDEDFSDISGGGEDAGEEPLEYEEVAVVDGATTDPDDPNNINIEDVEVDAYTVTQVDEDTTIETSDGTIADFSLTNAFFSLGSLVQASLVSFTDNNQLNINSIFDSSEFLLVVEDGGTVEVAQQNDFGDLGYVYISITNGNLTQDTNIVFLPDGDDPTYIYYNTTEIDFEDGSIYYYDESITNADETDTATHLTIDETGFTTLELHPNNTYTINDYSITNTGEESLFLCKNDPLCDINIVGNSIATSGIITFSYQDQILYESFDNNNRMQIDVESGVMSTANTRASQELLSYSYSYHHKITETTDNIFILPQETEYATLIREYSAENLNKTIALDSLGAFLSINFAAHSYQEEQDNEITGAVIGTSTSSLSSYLLLLGGAMLFLTLISMKRQKRAQASPLIIFGMLFIFIIAMILFFTISNTGSTTEQDLAEIESLTDADLAVQECMTSLIEEAIYVQGMHGGLVVSERSFSSFDTTYDIRSLEDVQDNMIEYVERNINSCLEILEVTPYGAESSGRVSAEILYEETIDISIPSIGTITHETGRLEVSELRVEFDINILEMHAIVEDSYSAEHGLPVENYEDYVLESFVDEEYVEMLIRVTEIESGFVLQVTKELV